MDDTTCPDQVPNRGNSGILPFLSLPRELRDQIYNHTFHLPDPRNPRALRIERRNLQHFKPSAAALLLILHHEYLLLNRQVAREALEILFKHHTVLLSCGPFVLQSLLSTLEATNGPPRTWLRWLSSIALDWVTFPNLALYPPPDRDEHSARGRTGSHEEWWHDAVEVDVDYIRGAPYDAHYDEHDHEGGFYDDNFYDPAGSSLYPSFRAPISTQQHAANDDDPFGFGNHDPFIHPEAHAGAGDASRDEIASKLDLLISTELTPLFAYLRTPTFALSNITLPLYFISASSAQRRRASRPAFALPLKVRYWVRVAVEAVEMLLSSSSSSTSSSSSSSTSHSPSLKTVTIRYAPWDIWASLDSADDLSRISEQGVWFDDARVDGPGGPREFEGEAFRALWAALEERGWGREVVKEMLGVRIEVDKWNGEMDSSRVGDELEVVFERLEN